MKFSKLNFKTATFVHTVSFMHKLHMEMRKPTVSAVHYCGYIGRNQKRKLKILAYFPGMCCVVTEFVYGKKIILFNLGK